MDEETAKKCEAFMCDLYPSYKKSPKAAYELRYIILCQKKPNSEALPPTSKKKECSNNCSCVNVGLSCTEARTCMAEDTCKNPHGVELELEDSYSDDEEGTCTERAQL